MKPEEIKKALRQKKLIKKAHKILDYLEAAFESWDKQIQEKRKNERTQ